MRGNWNLVKAIFESLSEYFRWEAIGIWQREFLKMSENISDERQLEFGKNIIWKCLRINSMRGNWYLAKTLFEIVLEYFRWEAFGIWQRQYLKMSKNIFDERLLEFGKDIIWKCLRIFSMRGNWKLAKTLIESVLEYFPWEAYGLW